MSQAGHGARGPVPADAGREEVEAWFVRRGVPHLIDGYRAATDIWTRATPVLVVAYLLGGLNALDLADWTWQRNLLVALGVLALLVATWAIANALRGRPPLSRPREIGPAELALFVVGPAVPSAALGQWGDALQSALYGVGVLALVYVGTSYAFVPLLRWAGARSVEQVALLAGLFLRVLPLLLLFTAFLFISSEVWQVAGTLAGVPYVAVLALFFLLGALFVLTRVPREQRGLAAFASWDDVRAHLDGGPIAPSAVPDAPAPPDADLGRRQRLNLALVQVFPQALQVTVVTVLLSAFFVVFGFLAITRPTTASWIGTDPAGVHVLLTWHLSGRELVLSEPLLRVSGFLGAFSGMYFTVALATDATYRDEFAQDVAPDVRQAVAVRCAYRARWSR